MNQPVASTIDRLVRQDGGRLMSVLVGRLRDFQLAEDSFQDALESALVHWGRQGLPSSPAAWLVRTAQRKALDRLRRAANFRAKSASIAHLMALDREADEPEADEPIADERLKLIFTCCHPALDRQTSVALTLRSICGLTTDEIARAFVVSPTSMAQRLVRARHKITKAGIAYAVPPPGDWPARLDAVLAVIYLTFNEGYAASSDQPLRTDLCDEGIRLCGILITLCPNEPEIEGLMALMRLHDARRATRLGALGEIVPLDEQERAGWDRASIFDASNLLETAMRRGRPGLYQLQAAIAALHAEATSFADTDWRQIAMLYDRLLVMAPNPVYALNCAVALSYVDGPERAVLLLAALEIPLGDYQPFHAGRADVFARCGDHLAAAAAYRRAIELAGTEAERSFLRERLARLNPAAASGPRPASAP